MGLRPGRTNGKKAFEKARKNGELNELPAVGRKNKRKQPTGVRCAICGHLFQVKLRQVRRVDGVIVPGCAACARAARKTHTVTATLDTARPTVITPSRPVRSDQDILAALGLLMRAAFVRSGDLLALPAPSMNAQMRPVRRQLARMCGPVPGPVPGIASGPVICLGPGGAPSPYQPDQIALWRQKFLDEMSEAVELRGKVLTGEAMESDWGARGERRIHHPTWEADCAAQRMQHAAFMYGNLLKAA